MEEEMHGELKKFWRGMWVRKWGVMWAGNWWNNFWWGRNRAGRKNFFERGKRAGSKKKFWEGGIGQGEKKFLRGGNWAGRKFFFGLHPWSGMLKIAVGESASSGGGTSPPFPPLAHVCITLTDNASNVLVWFGKKIHLHFSRTLWDKAFTSLLQYHF